MHDIRIPVITSVLLAFLCVGGQPAPAQTPTAPVLPGGTTLKLSDPEVLRIVSTSTKSPKPAVLLDGLLAGWHATGDGRLFQALVDSTKPDNGTERGAALVELYRVLQEKQYFLKAQAALTLIQERSKSTGDSCEKSERNRFFALYGVTFDEPSLTAQAINEQARLLATHSQHLRDRVCVASGAVDLLDIVPEFQTVRLRKSAVHVLVELLKRPVIEEGAATHLMLVYVLAKAVRLGVAPLTAMNSALSLWNSSRAMQAQELNDVLDGAYLLAQSEMIAQSRAGSFLASARGHRVVFDGWYNRQFRKTATGHEELFHYKANDEADSGYSAWARMFVQYGMTASTLEHAPTPADLAEVSVYVIASPEPAGSKSDVHLMDIATASVILAWVKAGGVLVVMQNDNLHADQTKFNELTDSFGIHFNATMRNAETQEGGYLPTLVMVSAGAGNIFVTPHRALMKETCTITVSSPAQRVANADDDVMMAIASIDKGIVFAATDPWLYNEYTDGRKSPLQEDNFTAAQELTRWLVQHGGNR